MRSLWLILAIVATLGSRALATPPEPTGAHPRMLLDAELRAKWRALAKLPDGPVVGAIRLCEDARNDARSRPRAVHGRRVGEGAAGVPRRVGGDRQQGRRGDRRCSYFTALLDDLDIDRRRPRRRRGGAARSSGYAIRNLAPVHRARLRLAPRPPADDAGAQGARAPALEAWLAWYRDKGYRAHEPGLELPRRLPVRRDDDRDRARRRRRRRRRRAVALRRRRDVGQGHGRRAVARRRPRRRQLARGLAVRPAVGRRVLARRARADAARGVDVAGVEPWLASLLRHHVYSLSPTDGVYRGRRHRGRDREPRSRTCSRSTRSRSATRRPRTSAGRAASSSRLKLADRDWLLYDALAAIGDKPVARCRARRGRPGTSRRTPARCTRARGGTHRRSGSSAECHATIDTDHRHPNAGNFALSRGTRRRDRRSVAVRLAVDADQQRADGRVGAAAARTTCRARARGARRPATLRHPAHERRGRRALRLRRSVQVPAAAERRPDALRDFVLLPSKDGRDAALLVIDRAQTGDATASMYLRFRTPAQARARRRCRRRRRSAARSSRSRASMRSAAGTTEIRRRSARTASQRAPRGAAATRRASR